MITILSTNFQFEPNIQYWLNSNNTYRVIFIQDQASWFVVSGQDFVVDAFNTGGIQGNGQVRLLIFRFILLDVDAIKHFSPGGITSQQSLVKMVMADQSRSLYTKQRMASSVTSELRCCIP
jgi:hypothetical protein